MKRVLHGRRTHIFEQWRRTFKHADYFLEADPSFPTDLALADMDGDGCADVVTVEIGGTAEIFKGTCDGNVQGIRT